MAEKIKRKSLPYTIILAKKHSEELGDYLKRINEYIKPEDVKEIVRMILETNIIERLEKLLTSLTNKGVKALGNLDTNTATQTLKFILTSQVTAFFGDIKYFYHSGSGHLDCSGETDSRRKITALR